MQAVDEHETDVPAWVQIPQWPVELPLEPGHRRGDARVDALVGTDLIGETRDDLRRAAGELGGQVSGAVMFNCILRRLEIDQRNLAGQFVDALADIPTAGFHTYGESWLGHINQTLTAVLFGSPRSAAE